MKTTLFPENKKNFSKMKTFSEKQEQKTEQQDPCGLERGDSPGLLLSLSSQAQATATPARDPRSSAPLPDALR